ncbi:MAG: hypothetical protein ACI9ES_001009, partial [Oceanospirillaceae bacterium]
KQSVTLFATNVSTNASLGVIRAIISIPYSISEPYARFITK